MSHDQEINIKSLILSTLTSGTDHCFSSDELLSICMQSINHGWLNIARSALAIIIIQSDHEESRELLIEETSQVYNALRLDTESLISQLWQRSSDSYNSSEFDRLVTALLIHDKVHLACTLAKGNRLASKDSNVSCTIARGCWHELGLILEQQVILPSSNSLSLNTLSTLLTLAQEQYPLPKSVCNDPKLYDFISLIPTDTIFFSANLIPRWLMIPLNARNYVDNSFDYSHPAMEIPSLLWEHNLPEPTYWLRSINDSKAALVLKEDTDLIYSRSRDECFPNRLESKNVFVRLGMPNLLDYLWLCQPCECTSDAASAHVISDFSPSQIVSQIFDIAAISNLYPDSKEFRALQYYATDTAFLMQYIDRQNIVDISPVNLLHFTGLLMMPDHIKVLVLDFEPSVLCKLVQATFTSTYPEPIPFIFDDDVLLKICTEWSSLNALIRSKLAAQVVVIDAKLISEARSENLVDDNYAINLADNHNQAVFSLAVRSSVYLAISKIIG